MSLIVGDAKFLRMQTKLFLKLYSSTVCSSHFTRPQVSSVVLRNEGQFLDQGDECAVPLMTDKGEGTVDVKGAGEDSVCSGPCFPFPSFCHGSIGSKSNPSRYWPLASVLLHAV